MNACWARHLTHISADVTCLSVFLWSLITNDTCCIFCGAGMWREGLQISKQQAYVKTVKVMETQKRRQRDLHCTCDCHRLKDLVKSLATDPPLGSRSVCSPDGVAAAVRQRSEERNPSDHGHDLHVNLQNWDGSRMWRTMELCNGFFFGYSKKLLGLLRS
jgi:hypothetical protein